MTATTRDLIARNRLAAKDRCAAEVAEFASVGTVGSVEYGTISGGQGRWVIIRPARALTGAQRRKLKALGWVYRNVGYGDGGGGTLGWTKP